jgi:ribosomal protein S18 acetylase RimI-like enzyme
VAPTLRDYRASDRRFVEALSKVAFAEFTPWAGRRTAQMAERPSAATFVAELEGAPVGFAIVDFAAPALATLDAIATLVAQRGAGVGRALLDGVEAEVRRRGVRFLRLVTAEANLAALDLFLKRGFRIIEHKQAFYPRRQNAVVLEKRV